MARNYRNRRDVSSRSRPFDRRPVSFVPSSPPIDPIGWESGRTERGNNVGMWESDRSSPVTDTRRELLAPVFTDQAMHLPARRVRRIPQSRTTAAVGSTGKAVTDGRSAERLDFVAVQKVQFWITVRRGRAKLPGTDGLVQDLPGAGSVRWRPRDGMQAKQPRRRAMKHGSRLRG